MTRQSPPPSPNQRAPKRRNQNPRAQGIFGIGSRSTAEPESTDEPQPTATRRPLLTLGPTSAATDREALVVLYNATDGPNWDDDDNWPSDAPLGEWYGRHHQRRRTRYGAEPLRGTS